MNIVLAAIAGIMIGWCLRAIFTKQPTARDDMNYFASGVCYGIKYTVIYLDDRDCPLPPDVIEKVTLDISAQLEERLKEKE